MITMTSLSMMGEYFLKWNNNLEQRTQQLFDTENFGYRDQKESLVQCHLNNILVKVALSSKSRKFLREITKQIFARVFYICNFLSPKNTSAPTSFDQYVPSKRYSYN